MSENKRYYWLKLKEDFFNDDVINWIEDQQNGKEYCLFYLKLCLKSLRKDGVLIREVGSMLIPYDTKKLAELTRTAEDTVIVAMSLFKKIGLIEVLENGALYLSKLNEMVGSETDKAAKMRQIRQGNIVTQMLPESANIVNQRKSIEKEKELELEKEYRDKEIDILSCKQDSVKKVIDYLNTKADTNYKSTTRKTIALIDARLKENFTLDDFYAVIDKKCLEWKYSDSMAKFLRPETLFGTKFESYLNQPEIIVKQMHGDVKTEAAERAKAALRQMKNTILDD